MFAVVPEICSVVVRRPLPTALPPGRYCRIAPVRWALTSSSRDRAVRMSGFRASACSTSVVNSGSLNVVHQWSSSIAPAGAAGAS